MTLPPESTPVDKPARRVLHDVLARVAERTPLSRADHAPVLWLIREGYMHVTPVLDRKDLCPYRLTPAGTEALERLDAALVRRAT